MRAVGAGSVRRIAIHGLLLCSAVLIGIGIFFLVSDQSASVLARRLEGSLFQVLQGRAGAKGDSAELLQVSDNGQGVIAVRVDGLSADVYRRVVFNGTGLDQATGAAVYWHRKSDPSVSLYRALTLEQVRTGEIALGPDDGWSGEIQTFGFVVQGPLKTPVRIAGVSFLGLPERN